MRKRFKLLCPVLTKLEFLCPSKDKKQSAAAVGEIGQRFSHVIKPEENVPLQREWQNYQALHIVDLPQDVDSYWHAVSQLRDGCNPHFPLLSWLAKALLVLSHSGADIERHFSGMAAEKTT